MVKKIKAQQADALVKTRMETIVGLSSGQMKFDEVDIQAISEYDPKMAEVLTKVKDFAVNYNPEIPAEEQPLASAGLTTVSQIQNMKSYARSITDVFMQNNNEKLSEFVLREFGNKSDGRTPSIKLAAFANLASLKSKANNQQSGEDTQAANKFNAIKAGVKYLQASSPYLANWAIGDFVVRNFLSGKSTNEAVMQEAKSVLRDKLLDRHKSASRLPTIPNKIVDGEASAEDINSGMNELQGEQFSGNYGDQSTGE